MKKGFQKLIPILIIFILSVAFVFPGLANAQAPEVPENYTLLTPIPCVGGEGTCSSPVTETNLEKYIPGIFNLAIGFSAAFAVLNLVWGGFQYLSTDAVQKKSEGRARLMHSIQGLVLVIAAWLILFTINPKLLNINLDLSLPEVNAPFGHSGTISSGSYGAGKPISGQQLTEDAQIRSFLQSSPNIKVYADPCQGTQTTNCVNLNGLPNSAQSGLKNLALDCPTCNITITGATEAGHKTHGEGKPMVDVRSNDTNLNNYIINNQISVRQTTLGPEYTVQIGEGQTATFLRESNPPHWHVTFK